VWRLLWAGTEGAARRCFLRDVEADRDQSEIIPPRELLLPGGDPTYGGIIKAAEAGGLEFGESGAEHQGYPPFLFVHDNLIVRPHHRFFFRGLRRSKKEIPYAIDYDLRD